MGSVTLFELADQREIEVPSSCGRQGTCNECVVEIRSGLESVTERTPAERYLADPFRLACQARSTGAVEFAPLDRQAQILTQPASEKPAEVDPVRDGVLGLACDIGTTTVVLELVDLGTGATLSLSAFVNPQRFGGSDVMNRISYDGGPNRGKLQKAIVNSLNHEIRLLCAKHGIERHQIGEVMIAGNSTMRDLFFGVDVQPIGQRPYQSVTEVEFRCGARSTTVLSARAHTLGLLAHPQANVVSPPLVASHVGADTAADLVATGMLSSEETAMLIDVGTNTEVVLAHRGRLLAASCPAGPAFEGGGVRYGMPGAVGAIESIEWNGGWRYQVIGGGQPQGLCGSGLIDLLAVLRRENRMSPKGVFVDRSYVMPIAGQITFSRQDASLLAQAKAANYCGQYILLREMGIRPADVQRLYLAGGFANYIDVRNAMEIGFLAPVPEERVIKVGNAALQGAKELLLSHRKRERVEQFVRRIEHVELETTSDFFDIFVEACQFKPMELS